MSLNPFVTAPDLTPRRLHDSRLLGVGHVTWLFLVPWLWFRLDSAPADGMFRNWMLAVIVLNGLSLSIDIADVARYAMGDRAPQVTVS